MKNRQEPEILFIVDRPNWAHDYKTRNLQHVLGNEYQIVKRYQAEVTQADLDLADLILVYYWRQFSHMSHLEGAFMRSRHKTGIMRMPPVRYFLMGENLWHNATT